jgi:hypothetical protein
MEVEAEKIYNIFCDYFGEDKVDFTKCCDTSRIIIWFPEVEITNEYDESVIIQDLFVRLSFDRAGAIIGTFGMIRSTYTDQQYYSQYCHSHVPRVHSLNDTKNWKSPCLGNGPIRETLLSLSSGFNEELYELLCLELDKYVHTESLTGGPYVRMSSIETLRHKSTVVHDNSMVQMDITNITPEVLNIINPFIRHLILSDAIKFTFNGSQWIFNQSLTDLVIKLSNKFIEYFNNRKLEGQYTNFSVSRLEELKLLQKGNFDGININYYYLDSYLRIPSESEINSMYILKFKDKWIPLKIITTTTDEENYNYFLNYNVVQYIMNKLLTYLNYNYTDENQRTGNSSSTTNKRTVYL